MIISLCISVFSQEYITLKEHSGNINTIAFSPDSKYIVSGDENGKLIFRETTGFTTLYSLETSSNITSINFSPAGDMIYTTYNGYVYFMNAGTKEIVRNFKVNGNCYFADFSADGMKLAVAYVKETEKKGEKKINYIVEIYETAGYTKIKSLKTGKFDPSEVSLFGGKLFSSYRSGYFNCGFNNTGAYLASGGLGKNIPIYSFEYGKFIPSYKGHSGTIYYVTFSPDGNYMASASKDETAKIWNIASGSSIKTLTGHTNDVNCAAFSPDSKYLATASDDETVKIWDVKTTQLIATLPGFNSDVYTVKFSPDGTLLAAGGKNEQILVWKTRDILPE